MARIASVPLTHKTLTSLAKVRDGLPLNGNALGALLEKGLVVRSEGQWVIRVAALPWLNVSHTTFAGAR